MRMYDILLGTDGGVCVGGLVLAKHARCREWCQWQCSYFVCAFGSSICAYRQPRLFRSARSKATMKFGCTYLVQMKSNAPVVHAWAIGWPKLVRAEMSIRWWGHVGATAVIVHTPNAK